MLSCQGNDGEGHTHLNLPGERLLRDSKVASKPRRDVGHYSEHDDASGYRRTNMTALTLEPGVLRVASAFPDPPFEVIFDGTRLLCIFTGDDDQSHFSLDLPYVLRGERFAML
jgi:hypothetical protein